LLDSLVSRFLVIWKVYTHKHHFLNNIKSNQNLDSNYIFSYLFGTKRKSASCQINRKSVTAIQIWFKFKKKIQKLISLCARVKKMFVAGRKNRQALFHLVRNLLGQKKKKSWSEILSIFCHFSVTYHCGEIDPSHSC